MAAERGRGVGSAMWPRGCPSLTIGGGQGVGGPMVGDGEAVRHERSLVSRRTRGGQQVRLGAWGDPSLIVSCCPEDFLYIEHSFSVYLSNTIRDPC
jgi:hypothetical protein